YREAEAWTSSPRAETRIEDARQMFGKNSRAGVRDGQDDSPPILNRSSAQFDPAAARHGAQRVQHQIQQNLPQTMAVCGEEDAGGTILQAQRHPRLTRQGKKEIS